MADAVQVVLDRMVDPLDELQSVFSREEIHAIVNKRRHFEYNTRRAANVTPADYIAYIQYEMQLHDLCELRIKKNKGKKNKRLVTPAHFIQQIHAVWDRCLQRFKQVPLVMQYIQVCKKLKSNKRLSKLFAKSVQWFPKNIELWTLAASHEYFENNNIQSARVFLQRGIRMNSTSTHAKKELYLQLFTLELHFMQKLRGRTAVLHGEEDPPPQPTQQQQQIKDENEDTVYDKVALVVYNNAVKSLPEDINMRLQFIVICNQFSGVHGLKAHIIKSILEDGQEKEELWIARALCAQDFDITDVEDATADESDTPRKKKRKLNNTTKALAIIRQALNEMPTSAMYEQAIEYLTKQVEHTSSTKTYQLLDETLRAAVLEKGYNAKQYAEQRYTLLIDLDKDDEAAGFLKQLLAKDPTMLSASLWTKLAMYAESNGEGGNGIFEKALSQYPISTKEHLVLLLEFLGWHLKSGKQSFKILQKVLLLFPSFEIYLSDATFGVESIPDACVKTFDLMYNLQDIKGARVVYEAVFSSSMDKLIAQDAEIMKLFCDKALEAETRNLNKADRKKRLNMMYDQIIRHFSKSSFECDYKMQYEEWLIKGVSCVSHHSMVLRPQILHIDYKGTVHSNKGCNLSTMYNKYRLLHIKNIPIQNHDDGDNNCKLSPGSISGLFASLGKGDKSSWCVETKVNGEQNIGAVEFLKYNNEDGKRAYCSFLLQKDSKKLDQVVNTLPFTHFDEFDMRHEPAIWFFFGHNPPLARDLDGRPEHTDSVTHDGTYHYQLSGSKMWFLRPTNAFREEYELDGVPLNICVECKQGDVIVIDTRKWLHRTVIPAADCPSISYARDFYLDSVVHSTESGMSNVDGLYATQDIEADTIVFTERDMPDCKLVRAKDPNCEIVELEDGLSAVITMKSIPTGEFFSVAESSDDESDSVSED